MLYHFDYLGKRGGTIFLIHHGSCNRVLSHNINRCSLFDFLNNFILAGNCRHPFTITTTKKRNANLNKALCEFGYEFVELKRIDHDFDDEDAFMYGYRHVDLQEPPVILQ